MKPIRIALIGVNRYSHSVQIHQRIQQMNLLDLGISVLSSNGLRTLDGLQ